MVKTIGRINKLKTRRGKRALDVRAPKIIENNKSALFVKGGKTSETISSAMLDLYMLKKPLANQLKKRNPFHPFEDETPFEKFSAKMDASLFVFGANSKKHPNGLVFGRMHDSHLLDMAELRIVAYKPAKEFAVSSITLGSKPCIVLEGTDWEGNSTMKRIGNLMVDFFRGPNPGKIRLQGLEHVINLTCVGEKIMLRVYKVELKKSESKTPRVELVEMGPSIDFEVQRQKLATESLFKQACRKPKQLMAKTRKNTSEDVFGNKLGRVHVGKQDINAVQLRKVKALKKMPKGLVIQEDNAVAGSDGEDHASDDGMEE